MCVRAGAFSAGCFTAKHTMLGLFGIPLSTRRAEKNLSNSDKKGKKGTKHICKLGQNLVKFQHKPPRTTKKRKEKEKIEKLATNIAKLTD